MNNEKLLVINWHITEQCNYHCNFCFAKWNHMNEIWKSMSDVRKVLENIADYKTDGFTKKRLNIVGGEPILQQERLWKVIKLAFELNFEISIITNGSHLEKIRPFAHLISQVGISVDSFDHETNLKIGRECCGKTLSFEKLKERIYELRTLNPSLKIKINTVINEYNFSEILVDSMARLHIDKWKLLRQMPFNGKSGISDFKYYTFLFNNLKEDRMYTDLQNRENGIFVEDNDVMTESYLMVAPDGRIFQNGATEYRYSRPLTEVPMEEALKDIRFDIQKFSNRYNSCATEEAKRRMKEFFMLPKTFDEVLACILASKIK